MQKEMTIEQVQFVNEWIPMARCPASLKSNAACAESSETDNYYNILSK